MSRLIPFIICVLFLSGLPFFGCVHDPVILDDEISPDDSGGAVDTLGQGDSGMMDGMPCDTSIIYFELQILPILKSNCATVGCHDAQTAQDRIVLESYESVLASKVVTASNLDQSDLYEVLVEDRVTKRMPPPPANRLDADLIDLIAMWIQQGAKNEVCESTNVCNTSNISYSKGVEPILKTNCISCHSGNAPSGGVNLSGYANVKKVVDNGLLVGVISWQPGFKKMPQGGSQLPACQIDQIKSWIDDGAQDN